MEISLTVLSFIFIFGLVIGSFLNVVILRTVSEESIVFPASKCPKCQTPLRWYHNIPVLSYIFLKGKCAFCHEHISIQYPLVELFTGIMFVAFFIKFCNPFDEIFGLSAMNPISWNQPSIYIYIVALIALCLFIVISGTDFIEKKVSDAHTYSLIGLGVITAIIYSATNVILFAKLNGMPELNLQFFLKCPILYSIANAVIGFLIMEIISRLGILFVGTRAFGEGDSYIAAGIGALFGTLIGISSTYAGEFIMTFYALISVLILSVIIQLILTLPIFIKKLINNKNIKTLSAICAFTVTAIAYFSASNSNLLDNKIIYAISTILLVILGLYTCKNIISGIKNNQAEGLYLPFGPAMAIAAVIMLLAYPL